MNFTKWPLLSDSTACTNAVPAEPSIDAGAVVDVYGVILQASRLTIPTSHLSDEEREAAILTQQARVEAELARQSDELRRERSRERSPERPPDGKTIDVKNPCLPDGLKYRDLRLVNCAGCSRTLLGESQEPLRADAIARGRRTAANFPPPVAARLFNGRPYCAACAEHV